MDLMSSFVSSASTSTTSFPIHTLATLSRKNSTDISLTSRVSTRSGAGVKNMTTTSRSASENCQRPRSPSGGSTSGQGHKTMRRYPASLSATPLPLHRLAKIASSFGVDVPVPHSAPETSFGTRRSHSSSSYNRHFHRATTATRLLLHVIPPKSLPVAESRSLSGSRGNARRGSLLPLHTTLKGQLEAIKREYNFPSITGLVVYLLDVEGGDDSVTEFIGPKIGDEAWKLLWYRALAIDRVETKRSFLSPPTVPSTSPPSPISGEDASETDSQSQDIALSDPIKSIPQQKLRSLHTTAGVWTSPSTTTLSSAYSNESRAFHLPQPSDTSQRSFSLNSDQSSIASTRTLPPSTIVGKIEFDIDMDKGTWYEPWAKRKHGDMTSAPPNRTLLSPAIVAQKVHERQQFRSTPLDPPITPITPLPPSDDDDASGYAQLTDSNVDLDEDDTSAAGTIARAEGVENMLELKDEDAWRELRNSDVPSTKSKTNPHAQINAMLEGDIPESDPIGVHSATKDLEEVLAKWNERQSTIGTITSREVLSPPPLDSPIALQDEGKSPSPVISPRPKPRSVPPPLSLDGKGDEVLQTLPIVMSPTEASPEHLDNGASANGMLDEDASGNDDDSGSEYSQIILQQKLMLDRVEQHFAQVSPRTLPDQVTMPIAETVSPGSSPRELLEIVQKSPRSPLPGTSGLLPSGFVRPSPGQPLIRVASPTPILSWRPPSDSKWPSVPFERVADETEPNRTERSVSPSVSGMSSASPAQTRSNATSVAIESSDENRKTQLPLEEDSGPSRTSSVSFISVSNRPATPGVLDPPTRTFSLPQPSSRFSADSAVSAEAEQDDPGVSTSTSRMSVKNFAKLFRSRSKSRDNGNGLRQSIGTPPPPIPSPSTSNMVPPLPSTIRTPSSGQAPSRPPRPATHLRMDSGSDPFHFDQPSIKSTISVSPPDPSKPGRRTSTSLKKRGILKGWGSSSKVSTAKTLAHITEHTPAHSRSDSMTSLSVRGLKATSRAESRVSVPDDSAIIPSSATPDPPTRPSGHTLERLGPLDQNHPPELTNERRSRSTMNSLRLSPSPALTDSPSGPRLSTEDVLTPRTSQLDIVPPAPPRQEATRI